MLNRSKNINRNAIYRNNKSGFTLVELLLYFAILSLIITMVSGFIFLSYQSRIKATVVAEVEQQGNQTMNIILQNIRNASGITAPATGASAASLTLTQYNGTVSPTVFDLSGGTLRITEGANPAVNITSNRVTASSVTFQNLTNGTSPGTVRVQFTLAHNNPSNQGEYSYSKVFTSTASLRQP